MKIKNILIPCFLACMITACNPGGGDTPKPGPEPTPEAQVNYLIRSSGATFGTETQQYSYLKGTMKKNEGFSVTFTNAAGYQPLTTSCFAVTIGGKSFSSGEGWTFNNNVFTMEPNYVVNDLEIVCTAALDPVVPTERYAIHLKMAHVSKSKDYPLPDEVEKGEYVFAYLIPDNGYRLPNPDLEKPTLKDQKFEIRAESRKLERGSDYYYYIEDDGSALLYIPSQTIETEININGECIQQFNVTFDPKNIAKDDGKWTDGSTGTKSTVVDENTELDAAFKTLGTSTPESEKKDLGWRFKAWTDDQGNTVPSTYNIESNLTVYGSYAQSECYVNFEELYNLMPVEDYTHKYKEEIYFKLEPKEGHVMPLNKDFTLKRKDAKTQEITIMEEGEDKDYEYVLTADRSSAEFTIHAESVIGNFHVYGRCPEKYDITIKPNGGIIGTKTEDWTTTAIQGDTLATLLKQEGITTDPVPPRGQHFTGWTFNDAEIDKDYQFTVSGTLKATYGNESFETVSWEKLASQTKEKTFEELKTYYGVDSFIGMEKKITTPINGDQSKTREIMVRVIGENHDTKTDSNKALLTFEFEEIINKNVAYWTDNDYWNEYEKSELRKEMAKESTMLETLNNFKIASVNKQTIRGGKNDATYKDQVTTTEQLFALSGVEIGISGEQPREKMNPDTTTYTTSRFKEGSVYSYYSASQIKPSMREKDWLKPAEGEEPAQYIPTSYLLRTPHALSFTDPVAKKDQSGYYGIFGSSESQFKDKNGRYDRFHDNLLGIAPAFAI